jgi:hypothetical protein
MQRIHRLLYPDKVLLISQRRENVHRRAKLIMQRGAANLLSHIGQCIMINATKIW